MPPRAGDAEHLIAQQALDDKERLNIFRPVSPLPAPGSVRVQEFGELPLPIAQGMDFDPRDQARRTDRYGPVILGR